MFESVFRLISVLDRLPMDGEAFCAKHHLSYSFLKEMLTGYVEINQGTIDSYLDALHQEGIPCSMDWLVYGSGQSPFAAIAYERLENHHDVVDLDPAAIPTNDVLDFEVHHLIQAFRARHRDASIMILHDDSMEPVFERGDFVGGQPMEAAKVDLDRFPFWILPRYRCVRHIRPHGNGFQGVILNYDAVVDVEVVHLSPSDRVVPITWTYIYRGAA